MYEIYDWVFDPLANELSKNGGETRKLERRSAEVLALLAERKGEVVSKTELFSEIWNGNSVSDHSVSIVISDLRTAFGDDWRNPKYIETVPKRGYRLIAPVKQLDKPAVVDPAIAVTNYSILGRIRHASFPKLLGAAVVLMMAGSFGLSMTLDAAAGIGPDDGTCSLKSEHQTPED